MEMQINSSPKKVVEKGPPGRPKHVMWSLGFRRVIKHSNDALRKTSHAAFCVYCKKVLCNTAAQRLRAHRRVCYLVDEKSSTTVEGKLKDIPKLEESDLKSISQNHSITFINDDDVDLISSTQISESEQVEEDFTIDKKYTKIYLTIAEFFVGCDVPFSAASSNYFKKMSKNMCPDLPFVDEKILENHLLDKLYIKYHDAVQLTSSSVLMIEGWKIEQSNSKFFSVILKSDNNESVFIENCEVDHTKDISQELSNLITIALLEAYDTYKTEIYAIITGNFTTNIQIEAPAWQFSCNALSVKLLINAVVPDEFICTVAKILKDFSSYKDDQTLEEILNKISDWKNYKDTLDYCLHNFSEIQSTISSDNNMLTKEEHNFLFDENFIRKLGELYDFTSTIDELVKMSLLPTTTIADITECWLSIQLSEKSQNYLEEFNAHRDFSIKVQSLAANYLHPTYRGRNLTEDHMNKVEEFLLNELNSLGLNSLQSYVDGTNIFKLLNQKDGLSAQTYWSLAKRNNNELSSLALKLVSVPASLIFSFLDNINITNINLLKPQTLKKLLAVKYYMKNHSTVIENSI